MDIKSLYQLYIKAGTISTDTRKITKGSLFFALTGENFNGNKFALEAIEKGAAYAIVDDPALKNAHPNIIITDNALTGLQQLANYHRKQLPAHVLAITGSNGKTTTKELVHQVLSTKFKTVATPGNFNNHIGLPLTILQTPIDTEILILEMGDNNMGEIAALCQIGEPDSGMITNIGKDHLEGFGSFENNLRAKSELFDYLLKTNGAAFINSNDPMLKNMSKRFATPIMYGQTGDFSYLAQIADSSFASFKIKDSMYETGLFGDFNFANIDAAFCIGRFFKIPDTEIANSVCAYKPKNNRSQIKETGKNTLLLDAYNANPSSVSAVLESFAKLNTSLPKLAILGDMLELGAISATEHANLIELVIQLGIKSFFCGPLYFEHKQTSESTLFFENKTALNTYLGQNNLQGHYILLKGSRGMRLETLLDSL
jgi:UDP-N-acetylmuramoyl-tripeptide--D-alanyl-D-alanine ligase